MRTKRRRERRRAPRRRADDGELHISQYPGHNRPAHAVPLASARKQPENDDGELNINPPTPCLGKRPQRPKPKGPGRPWGQKPLAHGRKVEGVCGTIPRAAEREFCVLLTAPRKKKSHRGKKSQKKFRAAREKQKKTPKKHKNTKNKNKNIKKTPKKKIRAVARKISPNAKKKSQFPWPRRGHQTGKIPALKGSRALGGN